MKILFIGTDPVYNELQAALPGEDVHRFETPRDTDDVFHAVFDASFDERHELPEGFIYPTTHLLIGAAAKRTLAESKALLKKHIASPAAGFNLLPTFVQATTKAFCANDEEATKRFEALALVWKWNAKQISDTVGMVTPRVLCTVINEAARTLEEGTATKEDIDRGMELGTGYPHGPLTWCDRIGATHVTDVLQALYDSTGDARYKTSPLLLRMRQRRETFY